MTVHDPRRGTARGSSAAPGPEPASPALASPALASPGDASPAHATAPGAAAALDPAAVVARTRAWVDEAVIGLNLCPFAKAVQVKGLLDYVVCDARDDATLLARLGSELDRLAAADPQVHESTLLIHPLVLQDFLAFNDFLDLAEAAVRRLGHGGVLQVASFHPDYRFADTAEDDVGNASNRSPYPTLHLLREDSVERAVAAFPEAERIWQTNIDTLEALGSEGWRRVLARIHAAAGGR